MHTATPVSCDANDTLIHCLRKLAIEDIAAMPILENGLLVGTIRLLMSYIDVFPPSPPPPSDIHVFLAHKRL